MENLISVELKERYFKEIYSSLKSKTNRRNVLLTRQWAKTFPHSPGVYCFFEDNALKYVGETGSIRERMADMLNTKNHNLRRLIGEWKFSNHKGYMKANSRQSYCPEIETKLCKWITNHLTVSCLPIHIGRKEFEDWLQAVNPKIIFFNKPKKRK